MVAVPAGKDIGTVCGRQTVAKRSRGVAFLSDGVLKDRETNRY